MDNTFSFFDAIGVLGTICFLLAYFLLQHDIWKAHDFPYLFTNLLGATTLLISLWYRWNLAAFLLEAAWCIISIYGLTKWYRNKPCGARRTPPSACAQALRRDKSGGG